jgi:NAD(P)-dependent dehydrogenase (short-subunit alcohol dehydrogenase family)
VKTIDLTQPSATDALAYMGSRLWGWLDILIANAAVLGPMLELRHVADVAWVETIEMNLTANWRLLRAFDPLLRRSESGRVVNLKPRCGPYAISKAAFEVLAKTYALETEKTQIRVRRRVMHLSGRFASELWKTI